MGPSFIGERGGVGQKGTNWDRREGESKMAIFLGTSFMDAPLTRQIRT